MTNKFHLTFDSWGTRLVAIGMFLYLATNTWHFIQAFIPADTVWHQPIMFLFFEGGLLYWFNRFEHASENTAKTIIAGLMMLVQLGAVGFATVYEVSLGLQQKMGINIDKNIVAVLPFVVTGLILLWIVAWAAGRLANEHFTYRIGHIAKHGVSPHVAQLPMGSREVTGSLVQMQQTGEMPALQQAPTGKQQNLIQRARRSLGNALLGNQQTSVPMAQIESPDAWQEASALSEPSHTEEPRISISQAEYERLTRGAAASPLAAQAPKGPELNGK